ncbi:hypothetical protein METP3_00121 [Methanosarcinales archaeon]|nr:hypothetical protein METP3_00121 [Methanosarcinales archaeon]
MKFNILVAIFISIIIIFTIIPASAGPDMSQNVMGRALFVHYWNIINTDTYYNGLLDKAQYINADSIMIKWNDCFFVSEMTGQYRDPLGRTSQDLINFIDKAHDKNITVILMVMGNYLQATGDSGCKGYFTPPETDPSNYFRKSKNGSVTTNDRLDFYYPGARAKRIAMIKYAVSTYDFDGIHIEEPGYHEKSISYTGDEGVFAEHGYHPINVPFNETVQFDLFHEAEKGMTAFFRELRENLSSLGPDYEYPYFMIQSLHNIAKWEPNNPAIEGIGVNITELSKKGYIDLWITEKTNTYTVERQKQNIRDTINSTPEIYHTGVTYISSTALLNKYLNPYFFDVLPQVASWGGTSEIIYASGYLNFVNYENGSSSPISPYNWLHNNPPKTKRTFNPIRLKAPINNTPIILPTISVSPSDQIVQVGKSATFDVIATGAAPLSYQWQKNGLAIPGATSESYTTPVTTMQDNGSSYRVKVTNSEGTVTSSAAILILISSLPGLITNHGFESGNTSWKFYTDGEGTFNVKSPGFEGNKAAELAFNRSGNNIQLYQSGIILEPNTRYQLSFAAYSTSGNDLAAKLFKHVSPNTNYGLIKTFNLTTNWQTFTTQFTTTGFSSTINDGRLQFWLVPFAASGDTYYIDDVRLENIDVSNNGKYDFNKDGIVDIFDLLFISDRFNNTARYPYPNYDTNTDGNVDILDIVSVTNKISQ